MSERQRVFAGSYRRFLQSWLDDPRAVGAVAPSGRPLAKLMTREIASGMRVLELGPGTGTVTREILARGVAAADLCLVERCPGFADLLERDYPGVTVVRGDATLTQDALVSRRGSFDAIVSGLPLVLFSREQKAQLLDECFRLLAGHGALVQFTYGGRCPLDRRDLARRGLEARCVGFIARNVPPAFVYRMGRPGLLQ